MWPLGSARVRGQTRYHARRERHAEHQQRGAAEPDRVGRADPEQHGRQNARCRTGRRGTITAPAMTDAIAWEGSGRATPLAVPPSASRTPIAGNGRRPRMTRRHRWPTAASTAHSTPSPRTAPSPSGNAARTSERRLQREQRHQKLWIERFDRTADGRHRCRDLGAALTSTALPSPGTYRNRNRCARGR